MRTAIHTAGLDSSTTIILSAKRGQAPTDLSTLRRVDDGVIIDAINAGWSAVHPEAAPLVAFSVDDDRMLIWLRDRSPAALAFAKVYLRSHTAPANKAGDAKGVYSTTVMSSGLTSVATGGDAADALFGATPGDSHAPDLVGRPSQVWSTPVGSARSRNMAGTRRQIGRGLVISGAEVHHATIGQLVQTVQIAPSILDLLNLNPWELQAVRSDHTATLPGI